jgi:hypothetical protein
MSTAFHLQTDSQTEHINQMIETFLRSFINLQQTDWVELSPLAEFVYNIRTISAHGLTPLYTKYRYHPSHDTTPNKTHILSARSVTYGHCMKAVVENCKNDLKKSSERMKKYANQSRIKPPYFEIGNLVMLNGKNIKTRHPDRKLNHIDVQTV